MEQEKKQAVALMRYSAIAPLITGTQEDYESLSAYFRTVSAKGIKAPDGPFPRFADRNKSHPIYFSTLSGTVPKATIR